MKKKCKRSMIATLVTLSLPTLAYGSTVVSPDGNFDIITPNIKSNINQLLNDPTLEQVTFTSNDAAKLEVIGPDFIAKDAASNVITNNAVLNVTSTPNSPNQPRLMYSGYCKSSSVVCDVKNTTVIMNNGAATEVFGAYSESNSGIKGITSAIGNAYITGNVTIGNAVYGGEANSIVSGATAIGNVYLMDNVTVKGDVQGAVSSASDNVLATGNVYLTGNATVVDTVYGAYSNIGVSSINSTARAIGNVYLGDNATTEDILGANLDSYSTTSNLIAIGNVYLTGNATVSGFIAAASTDDSYSSVAKGNVYIYGNVKLQDDSSGVSQYKSNIFGGYLDALPTYYNVFNDNLLSMGNAPLTIKNLGNFATYNFYLNDYNKQVVNTNKGLLTVTNSIQNNNTVEDDGGGAITTKNKSAVHLAGISGEGLVKQGDTITLIDASGSGTRFIQGDSAAESISNIAGLFSTKTGDIEKDVQVGLVRKVDVSYIVDEINNKILVTIGGMNVDKELAQKNIKPLAEARVAALQNTTRGADLLLGVMSDKKEVGTFTPIAAIDGGLNTYHSGSSVDTRDYRVIVGSRYQFLEDLYAGIAIEYGRSNYDTNNHSNGEKIKGDGHTYNYGVSLFTKYTHDLDVGSIYADAAFRFGRTSTEFKSNDIVLGDGNRVHYKSKVNYVGGLVGGGYIYPLNDTSSFDSSIHYLYTRLGSDSVVLDGDKVDFKNSTSSRVQLKEQYNFKSSEQITLYLSGTYEYEFNGKGKASVSGVSIDAPSVKGSTGILEAGIKAMPITDNKDFKVNVGVKGYGGKRNGVSANAFVEYDF